MPPVWREPSRAFFHAGIGWWIVFPIPVAVISFLLVASLASWFCFLVYALVNVVCAGASLALLVPAAAALRGRGAPAPRQADHSRRPACSAST